MSERRYYSQDAEMQAKREIGLLIVIGLALGAGIGSVLALLFAPKKGEAMRGDLANMMEKRMGTIEQQVNDMRRKLEDRVNDLT